MYEPRIVVLGGGTGSFTLLQGLKKLTPHLTAIVSMSDDGGSTGTLRDELGVLPPGDIRQCLVALSDSQVVRNLFDYRFNAGRFAGQSLGNIILSGLELQYGDFQEAIQVAADILQIQGKVIPVTLQKHTLVVSDKGKTYRTERVIDGALPLDKDAVVSLDPIVQLNPVAANAIQEADMVVIAPGSLYTSLLPIMVVDGLADELHISAAQVVCVANLVNKPLQTDNWHVSDYVSCMERYIGTNRINTVLYNNEPISQRLLNRYASEGEFPVDNARVRFEEIAAQPIGVRLVSKAISAQQTGDKIKRTLIRHDAARVCIELQKLLKV